MFDYQQCSVGLPVLTMTLRRCDVDEWYGKSDVCSLDYSTVFYLKMNMIRKYLIVKISRINKM